METIYLDMLFELIGVLKIRTETLNMSLYDIKDQQIRQRMGFDMSVVDFVIKQKY